MNKEIFLVSLGCSKNLVDSQNVLGRLSEEGYTLQSDESRAGIFMINTCGFIGPAREEGYAHIEDALAWKEQYGGVIVILGCMPQKDAAELEKKFPEIDVISGFSGYAQLATSIEQAASGTKVRTVDTTQYAVPDAQNPVILTGGATAYLKLAEGCSKSCAFCAIPAIRGRQVSTPIDELVTRATDLVERGIREIILIAQDPITYGRDLDGDITILDAIDALEQIEELDWLRLHYLFPEKMAKPIIERMNGSEKLLPYIDIPLQHGHPDILKLMNRPPLGDIPHYLSEARNQNPDLTLRTTFIVGFPGETEEHFQALMDLIEQVRFDRVGAFAYSPEEGTAAAELPHQVPEDVIQARCERLMTRAAEISSELNAAKVGSEQLIIIDSPATEGLSAVGRTMGQSPDVDGITYVEGDDLEAGDIIVAEIVGYNDFDLYAEF